jgi:hypothetical protein
MWMNEMEIDEAAGRYRLHPVLGPATRTLASLRDFANNNSDGWPYWRKPRQAAAKLMELVERQGRHENLTDDSGRYTGESVRADATVAAYKAALTPVKAFRTRYEKTAGAGLRPVFAIHEPGKGVGGEVWAAEQAWSDAATMADEAEHEAGALRQLADQAKAELNAARLRQNWRELAGQAGDGALDADLREAARLGEPGTRLWLLPAYEADGFRGLGELATSTGVNYGMGGAYIAYVTDAGKAGRIHPKASPMTPDEARGLFWITDEQGANLVSGGHRDRDRMVALVAERYPGCLVLPGAHFIPEA